MAKRRRTHQKSLPLRDVPKMAEPNLQRDVIVQVYESAGGGLPRSIGYNFNRGALFHADRRSGAEVTLPSDPWCIWTPGPFLSYFIGRGVKAPLLYVGHHTEYDEFFMNYMTRRQVQGLDTKFESAALENLVQHGYMFISHCLGSGDMRVLDQITGDYDFLYIEKLDLTEDVGVSEDIINRAIGRMKDVVGSAALEQWGKVLAEGFT